MASQAPERRPSRCSPDHAARTSGADTCHRPGGSDSAAAVSFNGCPCLSLDLTNPEEESLASFMRLAGDWRSNQYAFAARAAEAFSVEPVSRRFFRGVSSDPR